MVTAPRGINPGETYVAWIPVVKRAATFVAVECHPIKISIHWRRTSRKWQQSVGLPAGHQSFSEGVVSSPIPTFPVVVWTEVWELAQKRKQQHRSSRRSRNMVVDKKGNVLEVDDGGISK